VIGKITGNVVATELVEVNAGGVIEGDVKAPRVIMNDGAIVIGALDMSAGLTSGVAVSTSTSTSTSASASASTSKSGSESLPPVRARLMKVELPDDPLAKKDSI
jgi:cytoskeletal protein CcmA (bactofilin family)